jgi:hypothetical protein
MLKICAQVTINAPSQAVWEVLSREQTFTQAQAKLDNANTPRDPKRKAERVQLNLTRWEENQGASITLEAPALRFSTFIDVNIYPQDQNTSSVELELRLRMGLMVVLRIVYAVWGKRRVENLLRELLAGLAYSAENGLSQPQTVIDPARYAHLRPAVNVFRCK